MTKSVADNLRLYSLLAVTTTLLLMVNGDNLCPGYDCLCDTTSTLVTCVNEHLDALPEDVQRRTVELRLLGTSIDKVQGVFFTKWWRLKTVVVGVQAPGMCDWVEDVERAVDGEITFIGAGRVCAERSPSDMHADDDVSADVHESTMATTSTPGNPVIRSTQRPQHLEHTGTTALPYVTVTVETDDVDVTLSRWLSSGFSNGAQ